MEVAESQRKGQNRNRQVSTILTKKVEVKIEVVDKRKDVIDLDDESRIVYTDIYGSSVDIESDDGTIKIKVIGKNQNGADRLTRRVLEGLGVGYKVKK